MTMKSLEEISLFYLPSKESETTYFFLVISLKGEVLNITSIQKKVCAGQKSRFKAFAIEDYNRHAGLGVKHSKEAADTAICRDIIMAKLSIVAAW